MSLTDRVGIADGAGAGYEDVLALNVRTEIAFGLATSVPTDGCTSLAWHTDRGSWLGQNWDWMNAQKENMLLLVIEKPDLTIKMVTEGGIVGKIGLNSAGVGVLLNAVKVIDMILLYCVHANDWR